MVVALTSSSFATLTAYFANNANYLLFRRQYLFVGSGVIEAGCKTVNGYKRVASARGRWRED
jgi:hypothetical protein